LQERAPAPIRGSPSPAADMAVAALRGALARPPHHARADPALPRFRPYVRSFDRPERKLGPSRHHGPAQLDKLVPIICLRDRVADNVVQRTLTKL
jgi:hypothetical protein